MLTQRPRGTNDILPDEAAAWQRVEAIARSVCRRFGFGEVRTPVFEHTELFQRGVGETTDIVEKEMYTFRDRGGRSLTLRPEGTAGVVRAFLENRLYSRPQPVKLYYLDAPIFRYERPQAGRLREHHQFGVEAFGSDDPALDAEVIALAVDFLTEAGLSGCRVHLNSLGCAGCRAGYRQALQDYYRPHEEELCADCRRRLHRNPLRLLDCKEPGCRALRRGAPRILDFLCTACREHFQGVQAALGQAGIDYETDPGIVRGLDYYTRTVFEILSPGGGLQGTVCGGGRYDRLVEEIGGPPTPAVGFGLGMERLLEWLRSTEGSWEAPPLLDAFVVAVEPAQRPAALALLYRLRRAGLSADADYQGRSLKAQMKHAGRIAARFACLIGPEEAASGSVQIKNMAEGAQVQVPLEDAAAWLQEQTGGAGRGGA